MFCEKYGRSGKYETRAFVAGPGTAPSTSTAPAVGCRRPAASLMSVVLPLPLGPSRPTTRPRGTASATWLSASVAP